MKRIGTILLLVFSVTLIIFIIEMNVAIDNNSSLSKTEINHLLFWSFVKSFIISLVISLANYFRERKQSS